jgi:hypothetical protein
LLVFVTISSWFHHDERASTKIQLSMRVRHDDVCILL